MMTGMTAMLAVTVPVTTVAAATPEKEQTVYVNADQNGNVEKVIVSNWLKNTDKESTLEDNSELNDITNVKGEESYTQGSNGKLVWAADGNDIYYQGETSQELPVSVKMTYFLDGREISAADLAGKSGKVKIRIDYTNNSSQNAKINGKKETIYTPFMMATGMILPTDTFTNVEVTNGKVISDGNNNIVLGIGFPGLYDSLKLGDLDSFKDKESPDYVEITADVEDFSLALTATVATTGTLNELGLNDIDDLDDLQDSLDKLTESSTALVEGSRALQEGIQELDSSADTLVDGLNSADDGAGQLKDGIDAMNNSKGTLISGIDKLVAGMESLGSGAGSLQSGVKSYTDGTEQLNAGIAQVNSGAKQLNAGISQLNEKKATLTAGVAQLSEGGKQLESGAASLQSGLVAYTGGAEQLGAGIHTLYDTMEDKLGNVGELPGAVSGLMDGCNKLSAGAAALQAGADQAAASASKLNDAVTALSGAVTGTKAAVSAAQSAVSAPQVVTDVTKASEAASAEATTKAKEAVAAENAKVNEAASTQATEKQRANVEAALKAAGVDEATRQAVLNNLVGIQVNVGVQTSPEVSVQVDASQVSTSISQETKTTLAGVQENLKKVESGLAGVSMTETEKQMQSLKNGADTVAAGTANLAKSAATLGDAVEPLTTFSTMAQTMLGAVNQLKEASDTLTALASGASALSDGVTQLAQGSASLTQGTETLKKGSDTLIANNSTLKDGTAKLVAGSSALIVGGKALQSGGNTLSAGIQKLADGAAQLKSGTKKLADGGVQLKDGTTKLADGSTELADGMEEFDEEGIQKIADLAGDDLTALMDRLDAVTEADKDYTVFDGWEKDTDGSVKFIIETAAIK